MKSSSVLFRILVVATIFTGAHAIRPHDAQAANCAAGYYWNGSACLDCGVGYYCNNDVRHSCWDEFPHPNLTYVTSFIDSVSPWDFQNAWDVSFCHCGWHFSDPPARSLYLYEQPCYLGPGGYTFTKYDWCNPGYYAINPLNWNNWYNDCAPCNNYKPANSHYSSYSTPSVMYAVESNCPWECDAGYGRTDAGTCQLLCASGITKLHAGGLTIPLYKSKLTSPAINIQYNGQICYASLAPGAASSALNINYGGNTYHSIR